MKKTDIYHIRKGTRVRGREDFSWVAGTGLAVFALVAIVLIADA